MAFISTSLFSVSFLSYQYKTDLIQPMSCKKFEKKITKTGKGIIFENKMNI